jgi:predicted DNA-binding transcriptional regulator YafY
MREENSITNSKGRLLELMKLIYEQTDENHQLSTNDILKYFDQKGFLTNRKTVKSDMDLLNKHGIDVVVSHGSSNRYFMGERIFQLPEIKMLMDSVISSKAITENKSMVLINKLKSLVSKHQAYDLTNRISLKAGMKSVNENIYYIVDILFTAIRLKKKVEFRKYDYAVNKERIYRDGGKVYSVSPYELVSYEDKYYLIGYFDDMKGISHTRVDNIEKPKIIEEPIMAIPQWFDMGEYVISMFRMYSGPTMEVELMCSNDMMRIIIDRFGKDVQTSVINADYFKARVNVALSPIFYSWIFQFEGLIKILSPKKVRDDYYEMLKKNLNSGE